MGRQVPARIRRVGDVRAGEYRPTLAAPRKAEQTPTSVAVVVPTRSRPEKLRRCLDSLAAARAQLDFPVYVCDSSPDDHVRATVREVCERYDWVTHGTHEGTNIGSAYNACARAAREEVLIHVDDDLELETDAIDRLLSRYAEGSGRRVVAGSVSWDGTWTAPMKMRPIGFSRLPRDGETPDFVLGAFFLYPRSFALAWPWNERIDRRQDILMGAVWRSHRVQIQFAEDARALHDDLPASLDPSRIAEAVHDERWRIYTLLFDALIANPSIVNALCYEVLGFMAGGKLYLRRPRWAALFVASWIAGHIRLIADRRYLRSLVKEEPPVTST
jgi:glycosyltransferase involved in cell wall biosynthesis